MSTEHAPPSPLAEERKRASGDAPAQVGAECVADTGPAAGAAATERGGGRGGGGGGGGARDAARGTILGVGLRMLSFLLTQLTVRFVDASSLGRASVRLDLLLSTALFLGREGFRLALTRAGAGAGAGGGASDGGDGVDESHKSDKGKTATEGKGEKENNENEAETGRRIVNVAWLSIPAGVTTSCLALCFHLHACRRMRDDIHLSVEEASSSSAETLLELEEWRDYRMAGCIYCLAAVVETLAEPLVILHALREMDVTTRAAAEGAAALARSVTCILLLSESSSSFLGAIGGMIRPGPVSAFGIGQLAYATVLMWVFYRRWWRRIRWPSSGTASEDANEAGKRIQRQQRSSLPRRIDDFHLATVRLAAIFTAQSVFKHALTEGDRIVLTALSDSYDQGTYAVASSYGGLASRLLFAPLEENARLLFSRLHRTAQTGTASTTKGRESKGKIEIEEMERAYTSLVKLVSYVGLLFACVGANYTSILLRILAGPRWGNDVEAASVLSAFCVYTALMAVNGTTEAFVYGVASGGDEVYRLGRAHAAVGVAFALSAPVLVGRYGTVGLVAANAVGMGLRIMYSIDFAAGYFSSRSSSTTSSSETFGGVARRLVRNASPHVAVLLSFALSSVVTHASKIRFASDVAELAAAQEDGGGGRGGLDRDWSLAASRHVGVGVSCVVVTASVALLTERKFGRTLRDLFREKRD